MNRKTILIAASIFSIICCGGLAIWGIYSLVNNSTVKDALQQAGNEFSAMFDLRQKLGQTYQCEEVSVQLMNGNTLNISFINSEFNKLSASQQAKSAEEVAKFVKANYTGKAKVKRIVIIFVENMNLGPLNTNRSSSYPFDVEEHDQIISTRG